MLDRFSIANPPRVCEITGCRCCGAAPLVFQGVSGSGKSTLGEALGSALGVPWVDADKLHPKANIEKMSAGHPLTDADRAPWLALVRTTAEHMCVEQDADDAFAGRRRGVVVACSALKRHYRDILRGDARDDGDTRAEEGVQAVSAHLAPPHAARLPTYFVYIKGEHDELLKRMSTRKGHFMKAEMLESQLATLESPEGEEGTVVVDLLDSTDKQVQTARAGLIELAGDL